MEGGSTAETKGIVPRSVGMIFEQLEKFTNPEWEKVQVTFSCFEIHIETVRDLLEPSNEQTQIMTNQGKFKATEVPVRNATDVDYVLKKAQENRKVATTSMNVHSSRSHSISQLKIKAFRADGSQCLDGALNLVDLAGSERLNQSQTEGERYKESLAINKRDVISAIMKKDAHIPYRNSKLTHMLQNYMGGDAKTLMIVNVSPFQGHSLETLNSLRFAAKVNSCKSYQAPAQQVQSTVT